MKERIKRPYGKPVTCVWEVTMGCNMRCGHCGSSCAEPLEDELTSEEALGLCEQLADLGLKWVTLSGGEPTTRKVNLPVLRELKEGLIRNWILFKEGNGDKKNFFWCRPCVAVEWMFCGIIFLWNLT